MAWRKVCILALALVAALPCLGDSEAIPAKTLSEYGAELDRLLSATRHLDQPGSHAEDLLRTLPQAWRVRDGGRDFQISTEWLRHDLPKAARDADRAQLIRDRLQSLREDLEGYQNVPNDTSAQHARLNQILAQPEFRSIHGPTWMDRFKRWLIGLLAKALMRVIASSAIPVVGKVFIYGLMAVAVLALAVWAYRSIRRSEKSEQIATAAAAVSAKDWSLWMAEARAAAEHNNWREAIHLAYWAGISFLEAQGVWRPDRARTPREYLRLMPQSSERHTTLAALTGNFEIVWYGNREADANAFTLTIHELEKLGCR